MGTINDALKALADEQGMVQTPELAKKAGSTEDTLRKQLSTLKGKGLVDGNSKEGWIITQEGRDSLDRQDTIPVNAKDVGADTQSKLKYYGQLASVKPDIILATIELVMSGDPEDLENVWRCMVEMDVPIAERRRWWNLWRNYLKQGIPPQLRDKVVGPTESAAEGEEEETPRPGRDRSKDYIIVDDLPVNVGVGLGDYTMKDAKDLLQIRAIRSRFSGPRDGGGGQGWNLKEIFDFIESQNAKRGDGGAAKVYALNETDQGTVLQEVTPGTPLNLGRPGGKKEQPIYIVDSDGILQEMKPGLRVAPKPAGGAPPAGKLTLVRQTDTGLVKEEYGAGEVVILNSPAPGAGGGGMLPFPVFDNAGKPVYDSSGKPVYANLEPTLRWLTFQNEQRRADERNSMLSSLVKTVRENVPDGIAALKAAAEEARKEKGGAGAPTEQPRAYKCGQCGATFGIPNVPFVKVICPGCKHEYTKEEVEAA